MWLRFRASSWALMLCLDYVRLWELPLSSVAHSSCFNRKVAKQKKSTPQRPSSGRMPLHEQSILRARVRRPHDTAVRPASEPLVYAFVRRSFSLHLVRAFDSTMVAIAHVCATDQLRDYFSDDRTPFQVFHCDIGLFKRKSFVDDRCYRSASSPISSELAPSASTNKCLRKT